MLPGAPKSLGTPRLLQVSACASCAWAERCFAGGEETGMRDSTFQKLQILGAGAKYDVSCSSSGVRRRDTGGTIGSAEKCGLCHAFTSDGRCVSLLKVLLSNACAYDCKYCISRRSNDVPRASFTPRELADLTIEFYRRNYIEGLFLSSAVLGTASHTAELMIETLRILREEYGFTGYIHAKAVPGLDPILVSRIGMLADRMSINLEVATEESLSLLCPEKDRRSLLQPMGLVHKWCAQSKEEGGRYRNAPRFAPAGQTTQLIIGATPESDYQILRLSQALYRKYGLKRVYYSAYIPVNEDTNLPALSTKPPLLREHRLYQADWLLRFYHFSADELLSEKHPMLHPLLDPKCTWAVRNADMFPMEVNTASAEELLRVPGIGVKSVRRILTARRHGQLHFQDLAKLGVVTKRARYFVLCGGRRPPGISEDPEEIAIALMSAKDARMYRQDRSLASGRQISFFDTGVPFREQIPLSITGLA